MSSTLTPTGSFFNHLHTHATSHVILTAETDDFDPNTLRDWEAEGFHVTYLPLSTPQSSYIRSLKHHANTSVSVNSRFAVVAFGDAAGSCLEGLKNGIPRLAAIVAYYPNTIPDHQQTSYPPGVSVLLHLCGTTDVGVVRHPEVLGIQGKRKVISRRVERGRGFGGGMTLGRRHGLGDGVGEGGMKVYVYPEMESGFAETDLDEYDSVARDLAWARSLGVVRYALGLNVDVENLRDGFVDEVAKNPKGAVGEMGENAVVLCTPTMTGGVMKDGSLESFYEKIFNPTQGLIRKELLSRTMGSNQVVDELLLEFIHSESMPWILPNIPPTNNRVEIVVVSIVGVKGGRLISERMYWDQASVLAQIGLLDPTFVSKKWKDKGVKRLPIVGAQAAIAITSDPEEDEIEVNKLVEGIKSL